MLRVATSDGRPIRKIAPGRKAGAEVKRLVSAAKARGR